MESQQAEPPQVNDTTTKTRWWKFEIIQLYVEVGIFAEKISSDMEMIAMFSWPRSLHYQ